LLAPGTRLLTLTGPGGIGKTHLALRVIEGLGERFPDGTCFVALGDLSDPALVLPTVAATLGLHESAWQTPLAQVIEALRGRRVLVVLDNFEQVTAAAVDVEHLLAECPQVTVLVTSQAALHLAREREYPVLPLALPTFATGTPLERYAACDSVALLQQCARAAQPDFAVTEANADTLAAICTKVDGIPLAIRLAAARLKHLPPATLLARLDQQLAVLTGGPRDAPARHHTVRATLDWSYQLLSPAQQALLRRLAVFAGGWSLEAAEEVCAGDGVAREDVLELLGNLVDHSLVHVVDQDGAARYRMLEPVRQYAEERLREAGEDVATRDRHLAWCLALAERLAAGTWVITPWPLMRLARPEGDNLRAALAWSQRDPSGQLALHLAGAETGFWVATGRITEGRQAVRDALARADPTERTWARAQALWTGMGLAGMQTDLSESEALSKELRDILREMPKEGKARIRIMLLEATVRLAEDREATEAARDAVLAEIRSMGNPRALAETLYLSANQAMDRGDYATARGYLEEGIAANSKTDDISLTGFSTNSLARVACAESDAPRALAYAEDSLAISRRIGLGWTMAVGLNSLGEVHRYAGDDERAKERFEQALAIYQEHGDEPGIAWTHHNLGHVALRAGDAPHAAELFTLALSARYRHRYLLGVASELAAFAGVASATGDHERGARLCGASEALLERIHCVLAPVDLVAYERDVARLRAAMEPSAFEIAWAEGHALPLEAAIAMALRPY
jgi:predicted ATPase